MKPQGHVPDTPPPVSHEGGDLDPKLILRVTAIILATLVALVVAGLILFRVFEQEYPAGTSEAAPHVTENELPPQPRLQANPATDLTTVRAGEDAHLERYAWTGNAHDAAQIPIERAMALWVQTYIPPTPGAATNAPPASGMTELQMRQQKAQEVPRAP